MLLSILKNGKMSGSSQEVPSILVSEFIDRDPISLCLTHKHSGKGELHNCKTLSEENTQTEGCKGNKGAQSYRDGAGRQTVG